MKLRISRAALGDLNHIYKEGLRLFGEGQAVRYQDGLKDAFDYIMDFPESNRVRDELAYPYRIHRYQSHIIIYRIEDDAIYITRVRNGREDWESDT